MVGCASLTALYARPAWQVVATSGAGTLQGERTRAARGAMEAAAVDSDLDRVNVNEDESDIRSGLERDVIERS